MRWRTDLAKEACETLDEQAGIKRETWTSSGVPGERVSILTERAERESGKKKGRYTVFESDALQRREKESFEPLSRAIAEEIRLFLGGTEKRDTVLVAGLGNAHMTADSIGPRTVNRVLVTRHLFRYMPEVTDDRMHSVCALAPGVLGVTGIESADVLAGLCRRADVRALIVVDALAARRRERMFSTFQVSDAGIEPGAGVGNKRSALTKDSLGIPVIALGVPTVIYASSLVYDAVSCGLSEKEAERMAEETETDLVVTPKEIDVIADDCACVLADAINLALHAPMSLQEIHQWLE